MEYRKLVVFWMKFIMVGNLEKEMITKLKKLVDGGSVVKMSVKNLKAKVRIRFDLWMSVWK